VGDQQDQPDQPAEHVEDGRQVFERHDLVLDDRDPPLYWVGVTLASSARPTVSNTSLATLSPSWKHAPTIADRCRQVAVKKEAAMRMPRVTGTIGGWNASGRPQGQEPQR
jgi:hypothetical protein